MATGTLDLDWTIVPRSAIEFPLVTPIPAGFDPTLPETWPNGPGRLEFVKGRLLYMPPCGDEQQQTAVDVARELSQWQERAPDYVIRGNEAGMLLGSEVRAADVAVWSRSEIGPATGGFPRVPPRLAIEIAGRDDTLPMLEDKATWYLDHGVTVVWLLVPSTRSVHVRSRQQSIQLGWGDRIPAHPALPGLAPLVQDLFRQLGGRSSANR